MVLRHAEDAGQLLRTARTAFAEPPPSVPQCSQSTATGSLNPAAPGATVKAYLYDPTGDKAKAVKARYRGYCRTCGADTSPRNGKGDAHEYCRSCRPGAAARTWTRERVRAAMRRWAELYGAPPSSYDWSRTHARRRGVEAMRRFESGTWPASATVSRLYGTWSSARGDTLSHASDCQEVAASCSPRGEACERRVGTWVS
jgi:hypothetical protein